MRVFIPIVFVLLVACQPRVQPQPVAEDNRDELTGAWRMTDMYLVTDEGDTVDQERLQYKVYVDGSVMWGFEAARDSTEYFGYGSYFIEGDSLFETMTSGSFAFRDVINSQGGNFFRIGLDVKADSYTQTIANEGSVSYEHYERVKN